MSSPETPFLVRSRGARAVLPRSGHFLAEPSMVLTEDAPGQLVCAWVGRLFIGISLIAFGVQEFRFSGNLADLQLVPDWAPAHLFWAWLAGTLLVATGVAVLLARYARAASFPMGFVFAAAAFLRLGLHLGGMVKDVSSRTVFFELLSCCAGSWMLAALMRGDEMWPSHETAARFARVGLWVFAVANVVFGIGHLQVASFIATLIPQWIPARLFLAYFTGCAFVAAGIAFAARRALLWSGVLLGLMYFSWVVVVHAPRIAHALHNGDEWNSGYVCLMMAGCALLVAGTGRPGSTRRDAWTSRRCDAGH